MEGAIHPFTIFTEYLKNAKFLNLHQAHRLLFFAWFHFTLSYRPGSKNTKADALSCIHGASPLRSNEELILPPLCFRGAITWKLDRSITLTPSQQVPHSCPLNKLFVPPNLRTQLMKLSVLTICYSTGTGGPTCSQMCTTLSSPVPPGPKLKFPELYQSFCYGLSTLYNTQPPSSPPFSVY